MLPPRLLWLLLAGTKVARRDSHPLKDRAFPRHTNLRTAIQAKKADEWQLLLKYAKNCGKSMDISPLCHLTTDPVMIDSLKNYAAQVNQQLTQAVASIMETVNGLATRNSPKSPALLITPPNSLSELIVDD